MKIGQINKSNTPQVIIIVPEKLITMSNKLMQRYLMPLGEYKKHVQVIGVPVPDKGVIKKVDFDEEWYQINNYCETMGVTDIMVTIPAYMKMITKSKKAYKFEIAQGTHEKVDDYRVYPLLNMMILNFQPDKLKLIQRSLNHLVDILSGNVEEENEALNLDMNLIYSDPRKVGQSMRQLLPFDKLTCDIEATGLRFESDSILTISFSWDKKNAICIGVHEQYNSEEESQEIKRMLKTFFTKFYAKGGQIIGHNFLAFDLPFIVHDIMRGRDFNDPQHKYINDANIYDTLIAAYVSMNSTDRPPLGLKELTYSIMGNYDRDIDQKNLIDYPLEQVATYNNYDVIANWYVYDRLLEGVEPHMDLFNRYIPVVKTVAKMKMNGFKVDLDKVAEAHKDLDELLVGLTKELLDFPSIRGTIYNLNENAVNKYNGSHIKQKTMADFDEVFKPNSTQHKAILFRDMLGMEVTKKSRTSGAPSYDKEVLNDIASQNSNEEARDIAKVLLDFNAARIVDSTFLQGFTKLGYEVAEGDIRLFTNFNVNGTISSRLSSNSPNFLNMPSGSKYGKLIKSCFDAPEGMIFAGADYNALEDRALINVSKDPSKYKVFAEGFDGHSFNTASYFREDLEARGMFIDMDDKESVNSIQKEAKDLRQDSKAITFGLAYGAGVGNIQASLGCDKTKAQTIFDNYWRTYQGVKDYYDKHISFAKENGYVISEFNGLRLNTPNINADDDGAQGTETRVLCNFLIQSSAFMLLEALAKFQDFLEENELSKKVIIVNSVYDSIYLYIENDLETIALVNKYMIQFMCADTFEDQLLGNDMNLEVSYTWDKQIEIGNECELGEIQEALSKSLS